MSGFASEVLRTVGTFVFLLATVYIGIATVLLIFQTNFVYVPYREITTHPGQIGLAFENVDFLTYDGIRLFGWFIPAQATGPVILFCHGNAGNISHRLDSIRIFHRIGVNVFIFDYRGYGQSEGKPTEKGTYMDAEAAWDYLTRIRRIPPEEIILFGRSLGGAIAAWLAHKHQARALIVESAFLSIQEVAAEMFPFLPVKKFSLIRYNTRDYIRQASCPVMIIHSREDELIPFRHGGELFRIAKEPKTFLEIKGRHNDGYLSSGRLYESNLKRFIFQEMPSELISS